MRLCGFSTGALSYGDMAAAIAFHRTRGVAAIELSALREWELPELVRAAASDDLADFDYVSVHAPSRFQQVSEHAAVAMLAELPKQWNIIVHPDVVNDLDVWRTLEDRLCLENMDQRKKVGKTASELAPFLDTFERAGFCLDLGHAHQIDPTMGVAIEMLLRFGHRLRQIHVSEVTPYGRHIGLTFVTERAYARIAHLIPSHVPAIVESVVAEAATELLRVRNSLEDQSLRVAS